MAPYMYIYIYTYTYWVQSFFFLVVQVVQKQSSRSLHGITPDGIVIFLVVVVSLYGLQIRIRDHPPLPIVDNPVYTMSRPSVGMKNCIGPMLLSHSRAGIPSPNEER